MKAFPDTKSEMKALKKNLKQGAKTITPSTPWLEWQRQYRDPLRDLLEMHPCWSQTHPNRSVFPAHQHQSDAPLTSSTLAGYPARSEWSPTPPLLHISPTGHLDLLATEVSLRPGRRQPSQFDRLKPSSTPPRPLDFPARWIPFLRPTYPWFHQATSNTRQPVQPWHHVSKPVPFYEATCSFLNA